MRRELHRCAEAYAPDCHGRVTSFGNLHLTLFFLGNVAADRMSTLIELAAQLSRADFDLEFGVTGYWRHNRIVWAAPHSAPEALRGLVHELEQGLWRADFSFDRQSRGNNYVPHVTLLRNARPPSALAAVSFHWHVNDFALIESVRGANGPTYQVRARWPLLPARSSSAKVSS